MNKNWSIKSLKHVDPFNEHKTQPSWISDNHPLYTQHHEHHSKLKKVEAFKHNGNQVEITNEITVKINGQAVMLHANFDSKGNLQCHNTPYIHSQSVESLVKTLLNNTPIDAIP